MKKDYGVFAVPVVALLIAVVSFATIAVTSRSASPHLGATPGGAF